jgi:hypothetical protein
MHHDKETGWIWRNSTLFLKMIDQQTGGNDYLVEIHTKSGATFRGAWGGRGNGTLLRLNLVEQSHSNVYRQQLDVESREMKSVSLPSLGADRGWLFFDSGYFQQFATFLGQARTRQLLDRHHLHQ